jgi:hypothetical protein
MYRNIVFLSNSTDVLVEITLKFSTKVIETYGRLKKVYFYVDICIVMLYNQF